MSKEVKDSDQEPGYACQKEMIIRANFVHGCLAREMLKCRTILILDNGGLQFCKMHPLT